MARKVGQIISRGDRKWLIWVYLGRNFRLRTETSCCSALDYSCERLNWIEDIECRSFLTSAQNPETAVM